MRHACRRRCIGPSAAACPASRPHRITKVAIATAASCRNWQGRSGTAASRVAAKSPPMRALRPSRCAARCRGLGQAASRARGHVQSAPDRSPSDDQGHGDQRCRGRCLAGALVLLFVPRGRRLCSTGLKSRATAAGTHRRTVASDHPAQIQTPEASSGRVAVWVGPSTKSKHVGSPQSYPCRFRRLADYAGVRDPVEGGEAHHPSPGPRWKSSEIKNYHHFPMYKSTARDSGPSVSEAVRRNTGDCPAVHTFRFSERGGLEEE